MQMQQTPWSFGDNYGPFGQPATTLHRTALSGVKDFFGTVKAMFAREETQPTRPHLNIDAATKAADEARARSRPAALVVPLPMARPQPAAPELMAPGE